MERPDRLQPLSELNRPLVRLNTPGDQHGATRNGRQRRDHSLQKRAEPALETFGQSVGRGPEPRHVMSEGPSNVKVPAAPFVGGGYLHVPGSHQMAEGVLRGLPDGEDHRGVCDVSNIDVNRVDHDHAPRVCNCATVELPPPLAHREKTRSAARATIV